MIIAPVCSQYFLFQSHEVRLALEREGCVEYLASDQAVSAVTPGVLHSSGYRPDTPRGLEVRVRGDSAPLVSWQRVMCASSYELWYGSLDQGETDSGIMLCSLITLTFFSSKLSHSSKNTATYSHQLSVVASRKIQ